MKQTLFSRIYLCIININKPKLILVLNVCENIHKIQSQKHRRLSIGCHLEKECTKLQPKNLQIHFPST